MRRNGEQRVRFERKRMVSGGLNSIVERPMRPVSTWQDQLYCMMQLFQVGLRLASHKVPAIRFFQNFFVETISIYTKKRKQHFWLLTKLLYKQDKLCRSHQAGWLLRAIETSGCWVGLPRLLLKLLKKIFFSEKESLYINTNNIYLVDTKGFV